MLHKFGLSIFLILVLFTEISGSQNQDTDIARVQILLSRAGFSTGEIDGVVGTNTQTALSAFQEANSLQVNGEITPDTLELLNQDSSEIYVPYSILPEDVKGPFNQSIPEDFMEQAKLPSLSYTSPVEALAEKFHCSKDLLKKLNPNAAWEAGEEIQVPNVLQTSDKSQTQTAAGTNKVVVVVSKERNSLHVIDDSDRTVFFAPVTAGSTQDPLPLGRWKVVTEAPNPAFYYNPELFWDADPSHSKAKLPPGPNNPVGTVWIEINAEHYGIHGTPEPGKVGHTESHGCVRLTNWDAEKLAKLIRPGTEVIFE
jgi:lipoprotein-anchoring transpeptidase ErfK/SrfK